MQLIDGNNFAMISRILDKRPEIRMTIIQNLMEPKYLKVALKLVKEYNLEPQ